jgi:protein involved in polysaccharide export with SLBB domain
MAAAAGTLLLVTLLGCATVQPAKTSMEIASEPESKLTLGPGDVLDIKFYYAPELNESQTVRPDGKITLQLIGEVAVMGKAPLELQEELVRAYTGQLKKPEVAVIVRTLNDRRVYVGGEVRTPGLIPMPGRITALEAIMQAGGFNVRSAEIRNVVLIRHKNGKRYGAAIDFSNALEGKEEKLIYLEPYDIVYVPQNTIAKVNLWIDQYFNKIIPRLGLHYQRQWGDGVIGMDTTTSTFLP